MFRKGQFLYYQDKMCQVAQSQDDELIYIIVNRKPYTAPDTIWVNMDEIKPLCPVCNEPSEFDRFDGDVLLCDPCAHCKMESADRSERINSCDFYPNY